MPLEVIFIIGGNVNVFVRMCATNKSSAATYLGLSSLPRILRDALFPKSPALCKV